jgi:hypothetical protein
MEPITFRTSTRFVISILTVLTANTERVEISCSRSKTTFSRMHGRFRPVYLTLSSTLFSDTLLAVIEAYTRVPLPIIQWGQ